MRIKYCRYKFQPSSKRIRTASQIKSTAADAAAWSKVVTMEPIEIPVWYVIPGILSSTIDSLLIRAWQWCNSSRACPCTGSAAPTGISLGLPHSCWRKRVQWRCNNIGKRHLTRIARVRYYLFNTINIALYLNYFGVFLFLFVNLRHHLYAALYLIFVQLDCT